MVQSKIWTTELVNETLEKLRYSAEVDLDCFHQRDPELKADNVLFQLTHEEEQEFIKCSQEIEYFVEKYCQFLTDYGRQTVDLRDFQRDILNTIGEEKWIEDLQDLGPVVRNYILMASRQTGKCFSFNTLIKVKLADGSIYEITIGELYNIMNRLSKKTFKKKIIEKIKSFLYNIYSILM